MARQTFVALRGYETALDTNKLSFLYFVGTGEETPPGMQLDLVTHPPPPPSPARTWRTVVVEQGGWRVLSAA